nr:PREDICTED: uncharacterized protein LOC108226134 [Daucus carota subsp. sativus]
MYDLGSQHFTQGEYTSSQSKEILKRNQIDWSELFGSENSSELENNHSQEFNHINLNASPYESENFLELENTHSRKFKLLNLNEPPFESENSLELENNHSREFNHINLNETPFESENSLELENNQGFINQDHEKEENTTENVLSNEQKHAVYIAMLQRSANGNLKRNASREVAALFSIPTRTVQRIWKRSKKKLRASHLKTKNCDRKRISELFGVVPKTSS